MCIYFFLEYGRLGHGDNVTQLIPKRVTKHLSFLCKLCSGLITSTSFIFKVEALADLRVLQVSWLVGFCTVPDSLFFF